MRPITPFSRSLREIGDFMGLTTQNPEVTITGLSAHSQSVEEGDLFLAAQGAIASSAHGADFSVDAVNNGARAILLDSPKNLENISVPVLSAEPGSPLFGDLASWFYGHPSRAMTTVGITGTNGKTTTTSLLRQLWKLAGREAGSIGTLGVDIGPQHFSGNHTTPDAVTLQQTLAAMAEQHITHAVMEVSSHALVQHRTSGTRFSHVGFTNLSQDHLDFHGDMESYFLAKAKLFSVEYADQALINIDSPYGARLVDLSEIPVQTISRSSASAQWHLAHAQPASRGYEISIRGTGGILIEGFLPFLGDYNLDNALMAIALAVESGVDPLLISSRLSELRAIPGRLESVDLGQNFSAVVDFAHSPDSVERVLQTLRANTPGRLIGILGCGGDRDRAKRAIMGRALAEFCDIAIFTSDNPRSENPDEILRDMVSDISLSDSRIIEVDRRSAITRAVEFAQSGDCIALLGKGHEIGQEINGVKLPFDDRTVLAEIIGGLK